MKFFYIARYLRDTGRENVNCQDDALRVIGGELYPGLINNKSGDPNIVIPVLIIKRFVNAGATGRSRV